MQNIKGTIDHLKNHQKYPATREELIKECDDLSDFSVEDKKWFVDNLPSKSYNSAEEVIMTLDLEE